MFRVREGDCAQCRKPCPKLSNTRKRFVKWRRHPCHWDIGWILRKIKDIFLQCTERTAAEDQKKQIRMLIHVSSITVYDSETVQCTRVSCIVCLGSRVLLTARKIMAAETEHCLLKHTGFLKAHTTPNFIFPIVDVLGQMLLYRQLPQLRWV